MNGRMCDYELTGVGENDIAAISRIHMISFHEGWSGAIIRQVLSVPGTQGFVARCARRQTIAGFTLLRITAEECEILTLAVAPQTRGLGLGALILDGAIQQATVAGAGKLFLEVAEDNIVARGLYESRGLMPVGRRLDYYKKKDGTKATAITMACTLGNEILKFPT